MTGATSTGRCAAALHRMYAARGDDAVAALSDVLAPDFVFRPAGTARSALQRDYLGRDGFLDFLRAQATWTNDTWWPTVRSLDVHGNEIVVHVSVDPIRASDGRQAHFDISHFWEVRNGRIVAFHSEADDQAAYDEFHAAAMPSTP